MGLRNAARAHLLGRIEQNNKEAQESTRLCVPNPFTQTANNNRLLEGPTDVHGGYPHFLNYFWIYGIVLSLLENGGHCPHSTGRDTEAQRSKDSVQLQLC